MLIREIVRAIGHRDEAKKRTILPGVVAAVPHDVCVFFSALHFMLLSPHRARVLRDCHTFRRMLFSACFACARAAAPRTGGFFAGFFRNHTRFCKNGCTHAAARRERKDGLVLVRSLRWILARRGRWVLARRGRSRLAREAC